MNLKNASLNDQTTLYETINFYFEIERKVIMGNEVHVCNSCGKVAGDTGHLGGGPKNLDNVLSSESA